MKKSMFISSIAAIGAIAMIPCSSFAIQAFFTNEHSTYQTPISPECNITTTPGPGNLQVCNLGNLGQNALTKFQCCINFAGCQIIDYNHNNSLGISREKAYYQYCTPQFESSFVNSDSQYGPAYVIYLAEPTTAGQPPEAKGCVLPPGTETRIDDLYAAAPSFPPPAGGLKGYALSACSSETSNGYGDIAVYIHPFQHGNSSAACENIGGALPPFVTGGVDSITAPSEEQLGYNLCPNVTTIS